MLHLSSVAVTAASCASEAVTELLRYAREGDGLPHHPFGTQDPTVELAQALVTAATIERDGLAALPDQNWSAEMRLLNELIGTCSAFVADRAGNGRSEAKTESVERV